MLDLSADVAASLKARERRQTRQLTPAQQRKKAREDWLQMRTAGKGAGQAMENNEPAASKEKTRRREHSEDDDDFSL
jgi:hypothetical protein